MSRVYMTSDSATAGDMHQLPSALLYILTASLALFGWNKFSKMVLVAILPAFESQKKISSLLTRSFEMIEEFHLSRYSLFQVILQDPKSGHVHLHAWAYPDVSWQHASQLSSG